VCEIKGRIMPAELVQNRKRNDRTKRNGRLCSCVNQRLETSPRKDVSRWDAGRRFRGNQYEGANVVCVMLPPNYVECCFQKHPAVHFSIKGSLFVCLLPGIQNRNTVFSGAFKKLLKATISCVMSLCPSAWNNSAATGRIFIKLGVWVWCSCDRELW
jgi:hypothetical protein